jgi:ABC-type uncharacterized transport system involved in gliding motility auxiliary subunit
MFLNALNWLAADHDEPDLRRLDLTEGRRRQLGMVSVVGLPGLATGAGLLCWARRRKR